MRSTHSKQSYNYRYIKSKINVNKLNKKFNEKQRERSYLLRVKNLTKKCDDDEKSKGCTFVFLVPLFTYRRGVPGRVSDGLISERNFKSQLIGPLNKFI